MIVSQKRLYECHPPQLSIRTARRLRLLQGLPGGSRLLEALAANATCGEFRVCNNMPGGQIVIAGNISSFLERQVYIKGGYEKQQILEFLTRLPRTKRGVILDIGANVGTHSLCFALHFETVHSFEPNSLLWSRFERNVEINGFRNMRLHYVGLGDKESEMPFYLIENNNFGLGTFSRVEQYDLPLKQVGTAKVVVGDRYLSNQEIDKIDAVKIDVQGFEPEVLRGLTNTLGATRPIVWCEIGAGAKSKIETVSDLLNLFPTGYRLYKFTETYRFGLRSVALIDFPCGNLDYADYVAAPCEFDL